MQESQVQEIQKSAGETLGELRKQKNLSVQEIANQLRLDVRIIEALEADNFDILPSPAYIRGYLRSYAKILSADSDRIISLYNHKAPQPPEIIPDVKHPTQVSSSDKPVKAFTYLVTFILVLLLFAWLQSNIVIKETPVPTVTVPDQPPLSLPYEVEAFEAPEILTEPANAEQHGELTDQIQREDEGMEFTGDSVIPEEITSEPGTVQLEQTEETNDQTNESLPPFADGTEGPDTISMKLTANSWIEVYDTYNNRLYMNLARSGDEISLKGTGPFMVKLGFSQGVTLYFNGDYFDPAPYSVGGVATFTLGE